MGAINHSKCMDLFTSLSNSYSVYCPLLSAWNPVVSKRDRVPSPVELMIQEQRNVYQRPYACLEKQNRQQCQKGETHGPTSVCQKAPDPGVGQEPATGKVPPGGNAWGGGWREKHTQSSEVEKQGVFQEEEQKEGPCGWGTE